MMDSISIAKRLVYVVVWLALAATAFWSLAAADFFAPSVGRFIVKPSDVQRHEPGYVSDRQRAFDVLEYRLELDVFPRLGMIRGTARITGESTAPLDAIDLNFEDSMAVRACRVNGEPTGFAKSGSRLSLAKRLAAGERAVIEIEYVGFPTPRGFGSFVVRKWRGSWILSTLNEPQFAYSWFPCDDDPADKARYEAAITVDTAFVALTNGAPTGAARRGARATYRRRSAYPISTYLIALYVAPYREFEDRYVSERGDTLQLRYHVLPGQIEDARVDFADHAAMFAAFERAFGRYPFWEDGYAVAAFAWRGGMEHQTITAVGAELITGRDKIDLLLAHELAHQWWGNAVGPASWNDVWLNEGFATYAEAIYMESREGADGLRRHMRRRFSPEFGGPLHNPPDGLFTKTTYWKGAWTLHALRGEVGDSLFFRILQDYFKTYRYGSVATEDFRAVCERVADREFGKFFDQFVYRGVGVIELTYDWRAEPSDSGDGNETLVLNVQQTQSGYDAYDVRLTLEWRTEDGAPTRRDVRLDRRRQTFRIPIDAAPDVVTLDPDAWLPAVIEERPETIR